MPVRKASEGFAGHHFNAPAVRLDHWDVLLAASCFVAGFWLYLRTLTPGLLRGDSGEFQVLAYLLGDTHPTGYPVYLILAKLMTFLPLGTIAYRVNLFSAVMGALVVASIYLSGRLLVRSHAPALVGAAVLAVSPTFWSQAVIAEVYTPGAAFLAVIVVLLLLWDQGGRPQTLFLAGLLGGLSLGVHMSVALFTPAVLLFMLTHWRRGRSMWTTAAAGAATGLLLTALAFWLIDGHNPNASYFNSIIEPSRSAWGLEADETDGPLERLLFGWSARQFHSFMFTDVAHVMPAQAADYWHNLPLELGWPIIWFALAGSVQLLIRRRRVGLLLLAGLVIQLICLFNYEIWDLYVFYIPSYVLLALFSIAGIAAVIDGVTALLRGILARLALEWIPGARGALTLLVVGFSLWPVFRSQLITLLAGEAPFKFEDYPVYDEELLDETRTFVNQLPVNAVVFTDWDMVWPSYYAADLVEDRTDLVFVETYPADDIEGVADSLLAFVAEKIENHPILFAEREPALLDAGFVTAPERYGTVRLYRVLAIEETGD